MELALCAAVAHLVEVLVDGSESVRRITANTDAPILQSCGGQAGEHLSARRIIEPLV